ncbi:MAG TPA: septal ring lytic transglycosylase RlpA family protein [Stellaceae bacterium]
MPSAPNAPAPPDAQSAKPIARFTEIGVASWYAPTRRQFRTADGERLTQSEMTAAHPSLPMQTLVRVTNLSNGRSITVRINDRGPYIPGRVIDVTHDAAERLGMIDAGLAPVRLEVYDIDQCTDAASASCLRWKRTADVLAPTTAPAQAVPAVMTAKQ